jgi:hypothetical protein
MSALVISIVQFQLRIIDAKNQSKNFYPNSLTQNVEMQKDFVDSIRFVQTNEPTIVSYVDLRNSYFPRLSEIAGLSCSSSSLKNNTQRSKIEDTAVTEITKTNTSSNDDASNKCAFGIAKSLVDGGDKDFAGTVFELFMGHDFSQISNSLQTVIRTGIRLAGERQKFEIDNGVILSHFRAKCLVIERYITVTLRRNQPTIAPQPIGLVRQSDIDPVSWMGSIPWEYVESARVLCMPHLGLGVLAAAPVNQSQINETLKENLKNISATSPDAQKMLPGALPATQPNDKDNKADKLRTDLAGALLFDLMAYYSFYQNLFTSFGLDGKYWAEQFVNGPIELTFIWLVIVCGALGAMLRLVAMSYNPQLLGKEAGATKGPIAYYFVIGIMCALITYILAKTAFAGLTEAAYSNKSGNLSPFVAAFLAIISGLMCEEAFHQIMKAGRSMLARSGSGAGGRQSQSKVGRRGGNGRAPRST